MGIDLLQMGLNYWTCDGYIRHVENINMHLESRMEIIRVGHDVKISLKVNAYS